VSHTRTIAAAFIAIAASVALTACAAPNAAPRSASPIAITPETGSEVAKYLRQVRSTLPGAFAVSPDGRNSYYTYCDEITCAVTNYSQPALRGCQSLAGTPCVILYVRNEPRSAFTRIETAGTGGRHGSEEQRELDFDFNRKRS
jgi:hypothetical protein